MILLALSSMVAAVVLGAPIALVIMFLPAVLELKKPKDSGPRFIMNKLPPAVAPVVPCQVPSIVDLEAGKKWKYGFVPKEVVFSGALVNLDA